jgi:integrase
MSGELRLRQTTPKESSCISERCGIVAIEAIPADHRKDYEAMARRRFQAPKPERIGNSWYLRVYLDSGTGARKRQRIKIAPASMPSREVAKIASEMLRPVNQGLITTGSATSFSTYVQNVYKSTALPLLASTVQDAYTGTIEKYLAPTFGPMCLRDLTPLTLQTYFSSLTGQRVAYPSILKIRDTLSSILRSAMLYGFLVKNPMDGLQMPPDKRGRQAKPFITPEQFNRLIEPVSEPYATMIFVATWTGLRVSELIGLKWRCIHHNSISIEERYCRGDWSAPKTNASAATIAVSPEVINRILRLKTLTVEVRAGHAKRKYKLVRSDGPDDLVFQSVKDGKPMSDQNILKRHLQPAANKLGFYVNWRALRTSHATWLVQAGADLKAVQSQMRHSRISTTMDIYAQTVPASQRLAIEKLSEFANPIGTSEIGLSHLSHYCPNNRVN